jgi:outer membrane murein-binding lipoprotein Lpp
MYISRYFLLPLLFAIISFSLNAQDSSNTLNAQFEKLKSESNNYQIYKVVEKSALNDFWDTVEDTLNDNAAKINKLQSDVNKLSGNVSKLENTVEQKDKELEDQASKIENMQFLGMDMTKSSYVIFTWTIILVLFIIVLVLYFRFKKANRVTKQKRIDYNELQEEFEAHRKRSRETETKIKRDLQTEINRVEEMKSQRGKS